MKERPILYQPSGGTEGEIFFNSWCRYCARDKSMNGSKDMDDCDPEDLCEIIGRTMAFDPDHDEYPREWVMGENGPCCTAFIRAGDEIKIRCELTQDMFGDSN